MANGSAAPSRRGKKKVHRAEIPADPLKLAAVLSGPKAASSAFAQNNDGTDEQYLQVAITDWLPRAAKQAGGTSYTAEAGALRALSRRFSEQHRDWWLSDLLSGAPTKDFTAGAKALAAALNANLGGDAAEAYRYAGIAQRSFRRAGSAPGWLRARLEAVYALQRSLKPRECLREAAALALELRDRPYPWIQAQLLIEQAACQSMAGELGLAQGLIARASQSSLSAGYGALHLRALGLAAAFQTENGNAEAAWKQDRESLERYWSGTYPAMRAYQAYSNLSYGAEQRQQWQVAGALMREAVRAITFTRDQSFEAMARYRLASLQLMSGETSEAGREFERSWRIFARLPRNNATTTYRLFVEIALADLEAQRGELTAALSRLERAKVELPQVSVYTVPILLYQALAEVHLRRQQPAAAEEALHRALYLAERGLASQRTEADRIGWQRETGRAYRGLTQMQFQQLGDPERALEFWEWYKAAPLRAVRGGKQRDAAALGLDFDLLATGGPRAVVLPRVRTALPLLSKETVISYARLRDGLAIWVFDNRGIQSRWVPLAEGELEQTAQRFAEQCADSNSHPETLRRTGVELYRQLLAPVSAYLDPARALVIETDGALEMVPFPALTDDHGQYLGERFMFVGSPGLEYYLAAPKATELSRVGRALVVGPPALKAQAAASFEPLPDAQREAAEIASRFASATLLSGRSATLHAVQRALANAEVFHFSGHALSSATTAGLLLAPDDPAAQGDGLSLLNASSINRRQLRHCKLAVFSSCSPARARQEGIADTDNLVRAFVAAGVPHVVASQWGVDSPATAVFMQEFYRALLAGSPVPRAVQKAARVVRSHTDTAHPYFWAAFSAFGRG